MKKLPVLVCVLLAILAGATAAIYFSKTAGALPHFFLGYAKGSAHKHTKHGLAFAGLAVVLLIGAWMLSGESSHKDATQKPDNAGSES